VADLASEAVRVAWLEEELCLWCRSRSWTPSCPPVRQPRRTPRALSRRRGRRPGRRSWIELCERLTLETGARTRANRLGRQTLEARATRPAV